MSTKNSQKPTSAIPVEEISDNSVFNIQLCCDGWTCKEVRNMFESSPGFVLNGVKFLFLETKEQESLSFETVKAQFKSFQILKSPSNLEVLAKQDESKKAPGASAKKAPASNDKKSSKATATVSDEVRNLLSTSRDRKPLTMVELNNPISLEPAQNEFRYVGLLLKENFAYSNQSTAQGIIVFTKLGSVVEKFKSKKYLVEVRQIPSSCSSFVLNYILMDSVSRIYEKHKSYHSQYKSKLKYLEVPSFIPSSEEFKCFDYTGYDDEYYLKSLVGRALGEEQNSSSEANNLFAIDYFKRRCKEFFNPESFFNEPESTKPLKVIKSFTYEMPVFVDIGEMTGTSFDHRLYLYKEISGLVFSCNVETKALIEGVNLLKVCLEGNLISNREYVMVVADNCILYFFVNDVNNTIYGSYENLKFTYYTSLSKGTIVLVDRNHIIDFSDTTLEISNGTIHSEEVCIIPGLKVSFSSNHSSRGIKLDLALLFESVKTFQNSQPNELLPLKGRTFQTVGKRFGEKLCFESGDFIEYDNQVGFYIAFKNLIINLEMESNALYIINRKSFKLQINLQSRSFDLTTELSEPILTYESLKQFTIADGILQSRDQKFYFRGIRIDYQTQGVRETNNKSF